MIYRNTEGVVELQLPGRARRPENGCAPASFFDCPNHDINLSSHQRLNYPSPSYVSYQLEHSTKLALHEARAPARHIHEQDMADLTSSPFSDWCGTMPAQGSEPLDDPRNKHAINNSGPDHVFSSSISPGNFLSPTNFSSQRSEYRPCSNPNNMAGLSKNEATPKPKTKANVDPRVAAAELKKKLLKDKGTRAIRGRSLGPLSEISHSTIRPDKHSSADTATTPAFVPHVLPQMPSQNSVDADAEDIAALIKSISSTTEGSQTKSAGKPTDVKASGGSVVQAIAGPGTPPSEDLHIQTIPGLGYASQTQLGRSTQDASFHIPSKAKEDEAAEGRPPSGTVNAPAPSATVQTLYAGARVSEANGDRTAPPPTSNVDRTATRSNAKPSVPPAAACLEDKRQQVGAFNSGASSPASLDAYTPSSTLGRSSEAKNKTDTTHTERNNITGKPGVAIEGGDKQIVGARLAKLVAKDPDLRDWLV